MGLTADNIATILSKIFLIFGGAIPYIPQYSDIARSGDASGFSTLVCFVLILANTLRIAYWFGHYFDEALLLQSVVMLIAMFLMLHLCVRVERLRREALQLPVIESYFLEFKIGDFWQWTNLSSYIQAELTIAIIASIIVFMFIENSKVVEGVGYAALMTEACVAVPQFVRNLRNRSVIGMNVMMVILWTIGDVFKGFFYIWKNQPFPFILCASIQICVDILIFLQILAFS